MLRKISALLALVGLFASPAMGFDSYWHAQCVQKAGEQYGFAEDAWKIMQLGNFSPDFFGPVADAASKGLQGSELDLLNQYQAKNSQVRGAAIFLHFDNLNNDFQRNADFDYLFTNLLKTTQHLLAQFNALKVDDRTRKALTLVTLGASLHTVQDFYSHSDWIHNDFDKTDVKTVKLPAGGVRAPTWFEFRRKHNQPDKWPFRVQSGIYPPPPKAQNTHTHMNHDNSQLMYAESENGLPLRSQAEYHNAGPVPARGDEPSNLAHQQLALNTAMAASIEWIQKVEEDAQARKAIESAKGWSLKNDPHLGKELQAGLLTERTLSCASGKWDGDQPPGDRGLLCRSVLANQLNSLPGTGGSDLQSALTGLAANLLVPMALKFTGMFWDIHGQYHVLEGLVQGLGSNSGHYAFKK